MGCKLLCACCQFAIGAPFKIPDKARETINPPVAAAIKVILSFTKLSQVVSCQLSVGAKHLEGKLSVIAKNSSPNASPVQLSVGAKDLEDKLSVIAKNSSANASPVQLSVVGCDK
jgi:plastocyanin domain-containing protein